MEHKVYWIGLEYSYDKNDELKGGFVYVFINALDVRDALDKLLSELKKQHLAPIEVEFISPYDKEMEWETSSQTEHYFELYEEAITSNKTIFDDFYAYENE